MVTQKGIDFDQIFGWEITLLEPKLYWKRTPMKLLPHLHFYNAPVAIAHSSSDKVDHNVLSMIEQIGKEEDFISVKLDVDSSAVELPFVSAVLQSKKLQSLIDEFFFEFHFRCDFLMFCGWSYKVMHSYEGFIMDRYHVLQTFTQLRQAGIRAHIWP